jgi:hypothetical protein
VSRFYGSLYTHSLPWALHGKAAAKKDRTPALFGNQLDERLRRCQDGQTIGVAIGPDTSFVAAEVVLTAVDKLLLGQFKDVSGLRYIDDYELVFPSRAAAEDGLYQLEIALGHLELQINPAKTQVDDLPLAHEPAWVTELRLRQLRRGKYYAGDVVALFDRAFELARRSPTQPILPLSGRNRAAVED